MAARDNLASALTALEASASSVDKAVSDYASAHANVMGDSEVQAAADRVFGIVSTLQNVAAKLTPSG